MECDKCQLQGITCQDEGTGRLMYTEGETNPTIMLQTIRECLQTLNGMVLQKIQEVATENGN